MHAFEEPLPPLCVLPMHVLSDLHCTDSRLQRRLFVLRRCVSLGPQGDWGSSEGEGGTRVEIRVTITSKSGISGHCRCAHLLLHAARADSVFGIQLVTLRFGIFAFTSMAHGVAGKHQSIEST